MIPLAPPQPYEKAAKYFQPQFLQILLLKEKTGTACSQCTTNKACMQHLNSAWALLLRKHHPAVQGQLLGSRLYTALPANSWKQKPTLCRGSIPTLNSSCFGGAIPTVHRLIPKIVFTFPISLSGLWRLYLVLLEVFSLTLYEKKNPSVWISPLFSFYLWLMLPFHL